MGAVIIQHATISNSLQVLGNYKLSQTFMGQFLNEFKFSFFVAKKKKYLDVDLQIEMVHVYVMF